MPDDISEASHAGVLTSQDPSELVVQLCCDMARTIRPGAAPP